MTQTIAPDLPDSPLLAGGSLRNKAEAEVLRLLRDIRFGQLTIQIHDSRIVQIERTTRVRFDPQHPLAST